MNQKSNNYAFIDSQNVNLAIRDQGWKLDFGRFRIYLSEKYGVAKAYIFIGYLPENKELYAALKKHGYTLIFKPIVRFDGDKVKGNVDAEMVLQAMIEYNNYQQAVLVTGDGDFGCLVKYFFKQDKLRRLIIPNKFRYSKLLRLALPQSSLITFMNDLRKLLEYKNSASKGGVGGST